MSLQKLHLRVATGVAAVFLLLSLMTPKALGLELKPKVIIPSSVDNVPIGVVVNGRQLLFDVPPTVVDGRVLVPVRAIFEALNADVQWNDSTKTVVARRGNTTVEIPLGSYQARVNGSPVPLDVPATSLGGRTLVPLRFVGTALGEQVDWKPSTRIAIIGPSPFSTLPARYVMKWRASNREDTVRTVFAFEKWMTTPDGDYGPLGTSARCNLKVAGFDEYGRLYIEYGDRSHGCYPWKMEATFIGTDNSTLAQTNLGFGQPGDNTLLGNTIKGWTGVFPVPLLGTPDEDNTKLHPSVSPDKLAQIRLHVFENIPKTLGKSFDWVITKRDIATSTVLYPVVRPVLAAQTIQIAQTVDLPSSHLRVTVGNVDIAADGQAVLRMQVTGTTDIDAAAAISVKTSYKGGIDPILYDSTVFDGTLYAGTTASIVASIGAIADASELILTISGSAGGHSDDVAISINLRAQ